MTVKEIKKAIKNGELEGKWIKYMNYFDSDHKYTKVIEQTDLGVYIYPTRGRKHIRFKDIIEILDENEFPEYYI
jgi:hypothetical protein